MEIKLENIGKIKKADICIDGITVIAGENDTGKSTIGKALFSMFYGFLNLKEKISEDRKNSLQNAVIINNITTFSDTSYISYMKAIDKISDNFNGQINKDTIKKIFVQYGILFDDDMTNILINNIYKILNLSENEIAKRILTRTFINEFYNQINHLNTKEAGRILLKIKGKEISVDLKENKVENFSTDIKINNNIPYIDDPLIINRLPSSDRHRFKNIKTYCDHQYTLQKFLFDEKYNTATDEIILDDKLSGVYKELNNVCPGKLILDKNGWIYTGKYDGLLAANLSAGLKTFVILKRLLQNGALTSGGAIILDEPEIHLHPNWQIKFAEIIALLCREFSLHILLNTHSPYFLHALEIYAKKYNLTSKCRFYLSEIIDDFATVTEVTENTQEIYKKLWMPFQKLEDEVDLDESV